LNSCSSRNDRNLTRSYLEEIEELHSWAERIGANKRYFYLVDFSIHSGKKRMFLYDSEQGEIIRKYMVSHGVGNSERNHVPISFSNVPGSLCSSVGMAVLGERAYSNWGINVKYWIDGLEATNSNMRDRLVVLHSYQGVSNVETYPNPIMKSEGCIMVSDEAMIEIDNLIQSLENKRVLIYTFKK